MTSPPVGIIMGSQSDWATMRDAATLLDELGIAYETRIVSAHRTPDRLWDYGKTAVDRGLQVIIAGAGGAAHLPGMMASKTRVPVIGVPVQTKALSGVEVVIVGPNGETVANGTTGEIWVKTIHSSPGYFGDETLYGDFGGLEPLRTTPFCAKTRTAICSTTRPFFGGGVVFLLEFQLYLEHLRLLG